MASLIPSSRSLRKLLVAVCRTRSEVDAFFLDHFSSVFLEKQGQDLTSFLTYAIKKLGTGRIFEALRSHDKQAVERHIGLVEFEPTWEAVQFLLRIVDKELPAATVPLTAGQASFASVAELLRRPAPHLEPTRVLVIGVTSGGKSTFINALLGDRLLPSDFRNSTAAITHCRDGTQDELQIEYTDPTLRSEQIRGKEEIRSRLKELVDAQQNPDAQKALERVLLKVHGSQLPGYLELVDTPGADADKAGASHAAILKAMASGYDVVLYLASIRHPPKPSDLALWSHVLAGGKPVVFVLSKCDLERDSHEERRELLDSNEHARIATETRSQKLARYQDEIRRAWQKLTAEHKGGLPHVRALMQTTPILEFSSEEVFAEPDPKKRAQQIKSVVHSLEAASRRHHALEIQKHAGTAASLVTAHCAEEPWQRQPEKQAANRRRQKSEIEKRIRGIAIAISTIADTVPVLLQLKKDLDTLNDEARSHVKNGVEMSQHRRSIKETKKSLENKWNEADKIFALIKNKFGEYLQIRDVLDPITIAKVISSQTSARLKTNKHVATGSKDFISRGLEWISELTRIGNYKAPEYSTNCDMFHEAFRHDVSGYQQIILDVVNRIQSGYIDKLEDEKRALGNRCKAIDSAPEIAPPPQEVLMGARTALQYLEATASAKLDSLLQVGKGTPQSETSVGSESVVTGPAPAPPDRLTAIEAVLTQLTRMRSEEGFLQAFLTNTGLRDRRTAANEVPKVLLLGPHREQAIHLVSLLGHRLRDFRKLADEAKRLPETAWLSRSPVPSAPLVQARLVLPPIWEQALQACQDRGLDLTLAPADHLLSADVPWERLLPGFDSIVVFFDMERVSAGVVDRERAPYFAPMGKKEIAQRECLACPYGALFAKALPSLFTQVMKEMRENQLTTNVFLYEDYDTRYTNFLLLLPELLSTKMDGKNQLKRSVVDLWLANGMSTEWPFTIDSLSKINIDHVRAAFGENSVRGKGT